MKLCDANLDKLPGDLLRPQYDRSRLTPGIVHIGLGNFHRAHQAWYLHRLMQMGDAHDWAILGAGVRAYDAAMRERLLAQDCLTTLLELDPRGTSAEVTGAMIDYLPIEEGNTALIKAMSDPAIRIVSLTVTEGGYYLDPDTGKFDHEHADIRFDASHLDRPRTAFGAMVAALKHRKAAALAPFTALSCDNLQGNGAILRQCVVGLAGLADPDLAAWIDREATFPNSMVDCIVPATGPDVLAQIRAMGIDDTAPVSHENFRQWVIEDDFVSGRPAWERVGATMSDSVHAYEAMKLRMLNAGHQLLANAGELLAVSTIADCMADPDISGFFRKVEKTEIAPFVKTVPDMTPEEYLDLIDVRFSNPRIRDGTRRVAFDGSSRHPGFLLPSLRDGLAAGRSVQGLALAEALWARMCAGEREDGSEIEANDPHWDELQATAMVARDEPSLWIRQSLYGSLGAEPAFADSFSDWLNSLWRDGCRETLKRFLAR